MTKRMLCFALALVLVLSAAPVTASAESSELGMRRLESGESYTQMTVSQYMLDMIKDMEGFRSYPYWDVTQWSIGYGSACGYDRNNKPNLTVTEKEAEQMLREDLEEKYGKIVNKYCSSINRQPNQQQFDALLDFTYNLGGSWTSGCQLTRWLENPTTEMDFVNAIGRWGRVSSKVTYSTCMRRIREAIVFMKGEYYLTYGSDDFESELEVVSNHNLPYYKAVIYLADGGDFDGLSDEIGYYPVGGSYADFKIPEREGYVFAGWQVTRENNSDVSEPYEIEEGAEVEKNLHLTAIWKEPSEETEPEETEPEETEPEETVPEETEPEETVPEETEPEETVPEETEPEETVPEETEPEETVPEETEPEETVPEETEPEETTPDNPDGGSTPEVDVDVELPFRDVPENAWYRESVEFVYANGYMSGMSETSFGPTQTMTRGMLVTVLYRIAGCPEVSEEQMGQFKDVKSSAYYAKAVAWAKANGIVMGISATEFGPNMRVTRQDAITIFYRYYTNYLMLDGSFDGDLSGFADSGKVSGYACNAVTWAVDAGLVNGASSSAGMMINPKNHLTRAEAARLLYVLVGLIMESV